MTNTVSVKLIKAAIASHSFAALKNEDDNHNNALLFVKDILPFESDEDRVRSFVAAGLKGKKSKNTLEEIPSMIRWWQDQGIEEEEAKGKTSLSATLVHMVEDMPGVELFHDHIQQTYITIPNDMGGRRTLSLSSLEAKRWLKKLYYDRMASPIPTQSFGEAHATLEAKAIYDGLQQPVHLRLARHKGAIYLNLGDKTGTVIRIDGDGYEILSASPIAFLKSDTMGELPLPVQSERDALKELQELLDLEDEIFHRVLAFLIGCFKPKGPYLCFIVQGEQGSGKSFLTATLKKIIDPSPVLKLRLSRDERDLMIIAKQFYLLVFDNISGIKNDLSDALCSLSTGSGFTTRKLYTDEELKVFNECRPFVLNGISGITHRPDLLDRSVSAWLPAMTKDKRKTESELEARFEELRPYLFDQLLRIASTALRRFDEVDAPKDNRMADAAKWLLAAEEATELPTGSFLNALQASQKEIIKETLDRNSLVVALVKILEGGKVFKGTVGKLLDDIEIYKPRYDQFFPTTHSQLSKELDRLKPALKVAGIIVEFGPKRNYGRTLTIRLAEDGMYAENSEPRDEPAYPI